MLLRCASRTLDLSMPRVMGVLNVTPDSFSDGGLFRGVDAALARAEQMLHEGAAIIDVGGESTRPGAESVSLQEELDRVCPVVERLAANLDVVVSVDTSTPEVMRQSLALGAGLINDVRAFQRPGALAELAGSQAAICLMHMQGEPQSMQQAPSYTSVLAEVKDFLAGRVKEVRSAGVAQECIVLDPGFGFGKTLQHNYLLLDGLSALQSLGYPLLVGVSRKSMIGAVIDRAPQERMAGSLAGAVLAMERGAKILRVHDVAPTVDAVKIVHHMQQVRLGAG